MHTHTPNGVAVSAQKNGLLPISQQSLGVLSRLGYHDYEGLALNEDEKPRLVRDLGDKNFLMLRNHGLLTAAASIADAFAFMYFFEVSCMIQLRAQSGGSELIPIPKPILDGIQMARNKVTRGSAPAHSPGQHCFASWIGWIRHFGTSYLRLARPLGRFQCPCARAGRLSAPDARVGCLPARLQAVEPTAKGALN